MTYPQRDKKRKNKRTLVTLLSIGSAALIIFLLNLFAPHLFSPLVHIISLPFFESQQMLANTVDSASTIVKTKEQIAAENQLLRDRLAQFDALRAEKEFYKNENAELHAMLGRISDPKKIILARILSKPGFSPYDTVVIDVGDKDGIKVGDFVLVDDNILLGEISTTYAHSSNVILYSSPEQKNIVHIGPDAIESTATGKGGGNFELKLPRNTNIKEGDIVTMSKSPSKVFGTISVITVDQADSFERVLFRSPADISELKYVTVEKQP